MKLRITKEWTRIPCGHMVTLFIPENLPSICGVIVETNSVDSPPQQKEGVLYRDSTIKLSSDEFIFIKIPEGCKVDEMDITYANFI